ncbi:hypothetical protein [Jiangella alkaliphila]|uniref:DUF4386 family protein n=1 Tax=Jiangella alkaliphila TaxID=419479 RepID=A0A1H2L2T3_9ACTN|nr:hypothetical protein [Jiangella alkaliphila]SDU75333.1 hypothetical protein SAMN04488563_4948 [Jiangella alkaliphila]
MTTSSLTPATARAGGPDRLGPAFLVAGGVLFVAGGATHPSDSGQGSKVHQLHEMLVDPMWYPSHLLMLLALAGFAAGILRLRRSRHRAFGPAMARLVTVVAVVACVATVAMLFHLLAALDADALADGDQSFVSRLQTVNETVADASWGLAIAALALAGGLTRTVGNRYTLPLGLVGGLAFALASATIAFTDRFDPLFPVSALAGLWAVAVGLLDLRARP